MVDSPESLSDFIRGKMEHDRSTIAQIAAAARIPYERFRKAVGINKYNREDVVRLRQYYPELGDLTDEAFEAKYQFEYSRSYGTQPSSGKTGTLEHIIKLINLLNPALTQLQKVVRGAEFKPDTVLDLYAGWTEGISMVLFCHEGRKPLEWEPAHVGMRSHLREAIGKGGVILYVFSCADLITGDIVYQDAIDREFDLFCYRMEEESRKREGNGGQGDARSDGPAGFVAMLRVRYCPYCHPSEKPTLFKFHTGDKEGEPDGGAMVSFTTLEIPETADGHGTPGVAVIPTMNAVAQDMWRFLDMWTWTALRDADTLRVARPSSYPPQPSREILGRIRDAL